MSHAAVSTPQRDQECPVVVASLVGRQQLPLCRDEGLGVAQLLEAQPAVFAGTLALAAAPSAIAAARPRADP